MAEETDIEWCDSTFNPWIGCTKVSPGCDHCYAEVSTPSRTMKIVWGVGQKRHRTSAEAWKQPLRWERHHADFFAEHGRRRRVFCASLADWLDNQVGSSWRAILLDQIRLTPHLDWLLLTKRIGNWKTLLIEASLVARDSGHVALVEWITAWLGGRAPHNVWLGASIVNQEEADRDIPKMLATPARVRFLSMEPLLGPVYLRSLWVGHYHGIRGVSTDHDQVDPLRICRDSRIGWVIVGGESGPQARPMHPDWARSLRDQCGGAGTPFMFKQWGEWTPGSTFQDSIPSGEYCDFDGSLVTDDERIWKVGKKRAGRLLDGIEHNGYPTI